MSHRKYLTKLFQPERTIGILKNIRLRLRRERVGLRADRIGSLVSAMAATVQRIHDVGVRVVDLNEMNFLNQSRVGASQGAKAALETIKETFEKLGDDDQVILSACPVHRNHISAQPQMWTTTLFCYGVKWCTRMDVTQAYA